MATDAFSARAAAKCVVAKNITLLQACRAGATLVEDWQPKAILHHKHKLDRAEVKPERDEGGSVLPVTSMVKRD